MDISKIGVDFNMNNFSLENAVTKLRNTYNNYPTEVVSLIQEGCVLLDKKWDKLSLMRTWAKAKVNTSYPKTTQLQHVVFYNFWNGDNFIGYHVTEGTTNLPQWAYAPQQYTRITKEDYLVADVDAFHRLLASEEQTVQPVALYLDKGWTEERSLNSTLLAVAYTYEQVVEISEVAWKSNWNLNQLYWEILENDSVNINDIPKEALLTSEFRNSLYIDNDGDLISNSIPVNETIGLNFNDDGCSISTEQVYAMLNALRKEAYPPTGNKIVTLNSCPSSSCPAEYLWPPSGQGCCQEVIGGPLNKAPRPNSLNAAKDYMDKITSGTGYDLVSRVETKPIDNICYYKPAETIKFDEMTKFNNLGLSCDFCPGEIYQLHRGVYFVGITWDLETAERIKSMHPNSSEIRITKIK